MSTRSKRAPGPVGGPSLLINLPLDTLPLLLECLPLRDLSAMALVSKFCRASITTKLVVRAAYMRTGDGNNTRKSMDELYVLMRDNAIHVPSPLRLLRIATGKKCEFCRSTHKTLAAWSFGVFACWDCASGRLSKAWNTSWVRYGRNEGKYDAVFCHPRNAVSKLYGKKYYVWGEHQTAFGEKIGPIVAWEDIDDMVNRMGKCNEEPGYVPKIDEYLEDELEVPDPSEYEEFNHAYLAAKACLKERTEREEQQKAERRRVREENKRKREAEKVAKEERKRKREAAKAAREAKKQATGGGGGVDCTNLPLPDDNPSLPNEPEAAPDDSISNQPERQSEHNPAQEQEDNGGSAVEQKECRACGVSKSRQQFSKRQWGHAHRSRCIACVQQP